MSIARGIDVERLIRIAGFVAAIATAGAVYVLDTPQIEALQQRIDEDSATLESDRVMRTAMPQFQVRRDALARSYGHRFAGNAQSTFVRDLTADVRRHHVVLVTAYVHAVAADARSTPPVSSLFKPVAVDVALRGSYADLLGTIADMSTGNAIVEVAAPTLRHGGGGDVEASVPVVLYAPVGTGSAPRAASGGTP